MAVIYCSNCELGVHYIDVCWGGKNGKPRLTKKQHKLETLKGWSLGLFIALFLIGFIGFVITNGFTNWN